MAIWRKRGSNGFEGEGVVVVVGSLEGEEWGLEFIGRRGGLVFFSGHFGHNCVVFDDDDSEQLRRKRGEGLRMK